MTDVNPKRLIEVDLPIRRISTHARQEKAIRQGHLSSLHIWWARRPLAACRAITCAALWPDPADEKCPEAFRDAVALALCNFAEKVRSDEELAGLCKDSWTRWLRMNPTMMRGDNPACWPDMRYALLDFIADFSRSEASSSSAFLEGARLLTRVAHLSLTDPTWKLPVDVRHSTTPTDVESAVRRVHSETERLSRPLVVDPFAGGGAIPLEAARVGADAFASDLNPIAVLLNKMILECVPRYGARLVDELKCRGKWVREHAEEELEEFYPRDSDGATPIAYLWARTITCEGPACGAEVPLIRSLWLAKHEERSVALSIRAHAESKTIDFSIIEKHNGRWVCQEDTKRQVENPRFEGTVRRGSVTCPVCGYTTPVDSVRKQLRVRHGGVTDARLFCVVTTKDDRQGRFYRLPDQHDLAAVRRAAIELRRQEAAHPGPLSLVPDETLPVMSGVFNAPIYGHDTWGSLFSPRQALALATLSRLVRSIVSGDPAEEDEDLLQATKTLLAFALDKQADLGNALNGWEPIAQCPRHLFGRQAIPMLWDFAEGVPIGASSGAFEVFVKGLASALETLGSDWTGAHVERASATHQPLADDQADCVITDPPYYNAVPYADLSDFFYVWLKRTIGDLYPDLFSSALSPKEDEICEMAGWDPVRYRYKDKDWFERQMGLAMSENRRVLKPSGISVVVFAHKSTAGWEAQLQAMIDAGWTITGSWPIDTENMSRLRAQGAAALASSIHLACRPREYLDGTVRGDEIGEWRDVLAELPRRIQDWMARITDEGVHGADAIFACLGPALEIYSRYARVEKASGEQVRLREYLEQVWAAVSREALSTIFKTADASGLEEDARLTAIWFWVLNAASGNGNNDSRDDSEENIEEQDNEDRKTKANKPAGYTLEYDAARKLAQGLGADLGRLSRPGGIVTIKGNVATLNSIATRQRYLIGDQLVLFGDSERPSFDGPSRSRSDPRVILRSVNQRQETLFDQPQETTTNREQPFLPTLGSSDSVRPLLQRLGDSGTTTLDRLHQAMLLFGRSYSALLGPFLVDTAMGSSASFWRLAQALSALYPAGSEEKRWVDGVLARKKGLGF